MAAATVTPSTDQLPLTCCAFKRIEFQLCFTVFAPTWKYKVVGNQHCAIFLLFQTIFSPPCSHGRRGVQVQRGPHRQRGDREAGEDVQSEEVERRGYVELGRGV